jgi:XTP/dITP diphosphohydrolase
LASGNTGKLDEFRELLEVHPIELAGLGEFPGVAMPEEGTDYEKNAVEKARSVALATGLPALADDSGLEVAALDGAPGPLSARYGGAGLDDSGRLKKLLGAVADSVDRAAAFVCWAALAQPDGHCVTRRGICRGQLLREPSGGGGFGYDPIFQPDGYAVSMAELPASEKNRISHRGLALQALAPELEALAAAS